VRVNSIRKDVLLCVLGMTASEENGMEWDKKWDDRG